MPNWSILDDSGAHELPAVHERGYKWVLPGKEDDAPYKQSVPLVCLIMFPFQSGYELTTCLQGLQRWLREIWKLLCALWEWIVPRFWQKRR